MQKKLKKINNFKIINTEHLIKFQYKLIGNIQQITFSDER